MKNNYTIVAGLLIIFATAVAGGTWMSVSPKSQVLAPSEAAVSTKQIVGQVATVGERETDIHFLARVDTGAQTCSLHTLEKIVVDGSKYMEENVGKIVRFLIQNRQGQSKWLERPIAEVREIRTSEGEELRYLVPLQLACNGIEREVLVSLNDRSRMTYTMLLGRNYLAGNFVVDVTAAERAAELLASGN